MESSTKQSPTPPTAPRRPEDRKPSDALPEGAPDGLKEAADAEGERPYSRAPGQDEDEARVAGARKEEEALEFLLGDPAAIGFEVPVMIYVPGGKDKELTFLIRQVDGKKLIDLENEYRTGGAGPFSELDEPNFNAALCAEATLKIVDKETKEEVDPRSEKFIGEWVTPVDAMRNRFRFQAGLLAGVTANIRRVSGYDQTRVGIAQRAAREAVSNS